MRKSIAGSIVIVAALLIVAPAQAQTPAPAPAAETPLIDAVKAACKTELTTFCKGVVPGQGRVLACLYAFEDQVSDKCVYAVYDAAMQLEAAVAALKFAATQCEADLDKFCADVPLGKGRGLECLRKNDKDVSQACKDALKQVGLAK